MEKIKKQLKVLKDNEELKKRWKNYQRLAPYSSNIVYEELFDALDYIINIFN